MTAEDGAEAEFGEELVFAGVHALEVGGRVVVIAGEVEQAVREVEGQLGAGADEGVAAFGASLSTRGGTLFGNVGADDDLGIKQAGGLVGAEVEAEHVRRRSLVHIALV